MRKTFGPVKKRKCKAENIQCGGTCLNPTVKTCRLKLALPVAKKVTQMKEVIQAESKPTAPQKGVTFQTEIDATRAQFSEFFALVDVPTSKAKKIGEEFSKLMDKLIAERKPRLEGEANSWLKSLKIDKEVIESYDGDLKKDLQEFYYLTNGRINNGKLKRIGIQLDPNDRSHHESFLNKPNAPTAIKLDRYVGKKTLYHELAHEMEGLSDQYKLSLQFLKSVGVNVNKKQKAVGGEYPLFVGSGALSLTTPYAATALPRNSEVTTTAMSTLFHPSKMTVGMGFKYYSKHITYGLSLFKD
jgi:hypothetical protein